MEERRTFLASAGAALRYTARRCHENCVGGGMHSPLHQQLMREIYTIITLARPVVEAIERRDRELQSSYQLSHSIITWKRSRRCPGSPGRDRGSSFIWSRNWRKARCSDEVPAGASVTSIVSNPSITVPDALSRLAS